MRSHCRTSKRRVISVRTSLQLAQAFAPIVSFSLLSLAQNDAYAAPNASAPLYYAAASECALDTSSTISTATATSGSVTPTGSGNADVKLTCQIPSAPQTESCLRLGIRAVDPLDGGGYYSRVTASLRSVSINTTSPTPTLHGSVTSANFPTGDVTYARFPHVMDLENRYYWIEIRLERNVIGGMALALPIAYATSLWQLDPSVMCF